MIIAAPMHKSTKMNQTVCLVNFTLTELLKDNKMTESRLVVASVDEIDYKREKRTFGVLQIFCILTGEVFTGMYTFL